MDGGIVTQAGGKAKGPRDMKLIHENESNKKRKILSKDKSLIIPPESISFQNKHER